MNGYRPMQGVRAGNAVVTSAGFDIKALSKQAIVN